MQLLQSTRDTPIEAETEMRLFTTLMATGALLLGGCDRRPQTYAADCAQPLPGWGREKDGVSHLRQLQPVYIASDGSVLWNSVAIDGATLRKYMDDVSAMNPEPQVILIAAAAAQCDRVKAVRAIMSAAPLCKQGRLCSEGAFMEQWPLSGLRRRTQ